MMGEYPPASGTPVSATSWAAIGQHSTVMEGWFDNGYFGHLAWQYGEAKFCFSETSMDEQLSFSDQNLWDVVQVDLDQTSIPCGVVTTLTATVLNSKGTPTHGAIISGEQTNWVFNQASCKYESNFEAPCSVEGSSHTFTATGSSGTGVTFSIDVRPGGSSGDADEPVPIAEVQVLHETEKILSHLEVDEVISIRVHGVIIVRRNVPLTLYGDNRGKTSIVLKLLDGKIVELPIKVT